MRETTPGLYQLSTGREFCANVGSIGISPDGTVFTGYDDQIDFSPDFYGDARDGDYRWTQAEKVELANVMIARWHKFKREAGTRAK